MKKEDISSVCLNCKVALASLSTLVAETQDQTWQAWLKEADLKDAMLLLKLLDILTLKK